MNKTRLLILVLTTVMLLSACATLPVSLTSPTAPSLPATGTPAIPPKPLTTITPVVTLQPVVTISPPDGDVMPRFMLAARQALADKLNLKVDQVIIISAAQVDWPNACLGLPAPNEMCAEIITPGYRVMLRANSQVYEVRTGSDDRAVRIAPQASGLNHPVAEKARQDLATRLKVSADAITVLEIMEKEWPDSCLGISKPDIMCLMVITPGYQVRLAYQGKGYIYHTNLSGTAVILALSFDQGNIPPGGPNLTWKSSGIECRSASLSTDTISFGPCNQPRMDLPWKNQEHALEFKHFAATYRPFTAETQAGSIVFTGSGFTQATPAEQRAIAEWVQLVIDDASGGLGGTFNGLAFSWQREGGIAGFCDNLLVYRSGIALATSCKGTGSARLGSAYLNPDQLNALYAWLDDLATFSYKYTDPATADAMSISLLLNGTGSSTVDETTRQTMTLLAQDIYAGIIKNK